MPTNDATDVVSNDVPNRPNDVPNRPNDVPDNDVQENDVPDNDVQENDVPDNDVQENDVPNNDVPNNDVPTPPADAAADAAVNDAPNPVLNRYAVDPMMTADCDDLAMGDVQRDVVDDDSASAAPIALPFAFRLYGTPVTHWSATTNGYAQLYENDRGTPSTDYDNITLPSARAPSGILAAFWDDLTVNDPALVRTATLGMGDTRRFVVEWFNVSRLAARTTLRFQIKLFESTNVIEYHYCTLVGADSDGASATVGLQSVDSMVGDLVGLDTAGTLTENQRIRFTPR